MTPTEMPLATIRVDETLRVRAEIDDAVVADYAACMTAGAEFPPIAVFFDTEGYYIADGFHRYRAAERAGRTTLLATPHFGNRSDALWFALGASRSNGQRLNTRDKVRATELALREWGAGGRTQAEIAEQIGIAPSTLSYHAAQLSSTGWIQRPETVVGRDGHARKIPVRAPTPRLEHQAEIEDRLRRGEPPSEIAKTLHASRNRVFALKRALGLSAGPPKEKAAVQARYARIREMAADQYTSRQIAAAVGLSTGRFKHIRHQLGIDVPADRAIGKTKRIDASRIVAGIVMDAANLTDGAELVDFALLNRAQIAEWVQSLHASREKLGRFIRRLKEQQHGEAAESQAVESTRRADQGDACATSARGAA